MKLSIVIPVHNNWNFTRACLADLTQLPYDTHEIIVVDNGSTDGTNEGIHTLFLDKVSYIRLNENTGFARACGIGYEQSNSDYVMFLNNDIRVQKNHESWTDEILKYADDYIVGPTGGYLDPDFNFIAETSKIINSPLFYMSGWNLTASKNIWKELILPDHIGPFSEEFGIAFFEDTDLSFRAKQQNIPFKIVPVPVIHFGHTTARKLNISQLYLNAKQKFTDKWKQQIKVLSK